MKTVPFFIALLIAFSLLLQNTCPHGYAGKTSVARSCADCPHKKDQEALKTGKIELTVQKQASHPPLFVLALQEQMHSLQPAPVETVPAFLASRYQDAGPYELLRPPQA